VARRRGHKGVRDGIGRFADGVLIAEDCLPRRELERVQMPEARRVHVHVHAAVSPQIQVARRIDTLDRQRVPPVSAVEEARELGAHKRVIVAVCPQG